MSGWQEIVLKDALECLIDYRGKSPKKSETGIPVISAKVVKSGRILETIEQTISPGYYSEWMRRGLPKIGDVVMTTEGPLGEVAQLDRKTVKYALGQRIVTMRGLQGVLENGFLKYLLMSPEVQRSLHSRATGSTVAGISQASLRSMMIPIAPLSEQREISSILGALDDKIEMNRRTAATLEEMARALYRSWFVDFDPVKAKADGVAPVFMDEATAALFPDRFGDNGLPEGWGLMPLSALCLQSKNSIDPRKHTDQVFDHYSLPAFDIGKGPIRESGASIQSQKLAIPTEAILFSRLNPVTPRIWWARTNDQVFASVASTEFLIVVAQIEEEMPFLYSLLTSDGFRANVIARVTGTSNSHQRVKPSSVLDIEVVSGTDGIRAAYGAATSPWFERVHKLNQENQTLASLHGALLPKLMSGELHVGEAMDRIEEAA